LINCAEPRRRILFIEGDLMHKPPPPGWPQMAPGLVYRRPAEAIDWLCDAFGFELRLKVEGEPGQIVHSELTYGQAMIFVNGDARGSGDDGKNFKAGFTSPLDLDGRIHQTLCMFVDDADAHCAHARRRGATIISEPSTHDYGDDYWSDRSYGANDCEGHQWWFMQRLRAEKPR
jgi:uncharacterized glyoxalase superfamily protein PhnB